jgi:hypothetical protein
MNVTGKSNYPRHFRGFWNQPRYFRGSVRMYYFLISIQFPPNKLLITSLRIFSIMILISY